MPGSPCAEVTLFTRCLVCTSPFPENEELEHFPRGVRVAYDPDRGRLWAVCTRCKRWTLAPIEDRWEALEELEKLVRDRGKLLSQTENISLLRVGHLELVRVGKAQMVEEAWWRYGRELVSRRQSHKRLAMAGSVGTLAVILGGMTAGAGWLTAWLLWENAPRGVSSAARWLRFGSAAWRGPGRCDRCGGPIGSVRYEDRERLVILPSETGQGLGMAARCPHCRSLENGGLHLHGRDAERTLRRVLAYHHHAGASEERVSRAAKLIQETGSPERLSQVLLGGGRLLGALPRTGAIALEIAANEASEQRLLELELATLEQHWREEEELAAIIDGELTPLPLVETLRRKMVGQG